MNRKLEIGIWDDGRFAIYGGMAFCFIPNELACFVQNVVDWVFETILCIVQNTVGMPPGFEVS